MLATASAGWLIADAQSGHLGGLAERPGNASMFKFGNLADIPEDEPVSCFKNTHATRHEARTVMTLPNRTYGLNSR